MASTRKPSEEILQYIGDTVRLIVSKPEEVEVKVSVTPDIICYKILVPQKEVGRIIGTKGVNIEAIRKICRVIAAIREVRVDIQVEEG
jgi:predicted RNA-binding protein YlqC (UPF0109 family)